MQVAQTVTSSRQLPFGLDGHLQSSAAQLHQEPTAGMSDLLSTKKGLPEPSFKISLASARGPAVPMGSFSCGSACKAIRLQAHSGGAAPCRLPSS